MMKTLRYVLIGTMVMYGFSLAEVERDSVAGFRNAVDSKDLSSTFQRLLSLVDLIPKSDEGRMALDYLAVSSIPVGIRSLSSTEAAYLAAAYANGECYRLYDRRPFRSANYETRDSEGTWIWGRLDPAGLDGFSARVRMDETGALPKVTIYFSSDEAIPRQIMRLDKGNP